MGVSARPLIIGCCRFSHYFCYFTVHRCSVTLGLEDKRISDGAFTASNSYDQHHRPSLGRLNLLGNGKDVGAWCPRVKNQWLQIDLGDITAVTKVATQGRYNTEDRVRTYKLSYSVDGIHWTWYKQRAGDRVNTTFTMNVFSFSLPAMGSQILNRLWAGRLVTDDLNSTVYLPNFVFEYF